MPSLAGASPPGYERLTVYGDYRYTGGSNGTIKWKRGYFVVSWLQELYLWNCEIFYENNPRIPAKTIKLSQRRIERAPSLDLVRRKGFISFSICKDLLINLRRNDVTVVPDLVKFCQLIIDIKNGKFTKPNKSLHNSSPPSWLESSFSSSETEVFPPTPVLSDVHNAKSPSPTLQKARASNLTPAIQKMGIRTSTSPQVIKVQSAVPSKSVLPSSTNSAKKDANSPRGSSNELSVAEMLKLFDDDDDDEKDDTSGKQNRVVNNDLGSENTAVSKESANHRLDGLTSSSFYSAKGKENGTPKLKEALTPQASTMNTRSISSSQKQHSNSHDVKKNAFENKLNTSTTRKVSQAQITPNASYSIHGRETLSTRRLSLNSRSTFTAAQKSNSVSNSANVTHEKTQDFVSSEHHRSEGDASTPKKVTRSSVSHDENRPPSIERPRKVSVPNDNDFLDDNFITTPKKLSLSSRRSFVKHNQQPSLKHDANITSEKLATALLGSEKVPKANVNSQRENDVESEKSSGVSSESLFPSPKVVLDQLDLMTSPIDSTDDKTPRLSSKSYSTPERGSSSNSSRRLFETDQELEEALVDVDTPDGPVSEKSENDELSVLGFPNIGNSCYMNAVLQSLLGIDCFTHELLNVFEEKMSKLPEKSLVKCMSTLLETRLNIVRNPSDYKDLLVELKNAVSAISPVFIGNQQHDAQEFLNQVLDQLKDEVKHLVKEDASHNLVNPVVENFELEMVSSYVCQGCGEASSHKEPSLMLSVDIPRQINGYYVTLQDALNAYFQPVGISRTCEKCSSKETTCVEAFMKLPRILIVHLKRYQIANNGVDKESQPVSIPVFLNVENFTSDETVSSFHPSASLQSRSASKVKRSSVAATLQEAKKRKAETQLQNVVKKAYLEVTSNGTHNEADAENKENQLPSSGPLEQHSDKLALDLTSIEMKNNTALENEEDIGLQTALLNSIQENGSYESSPVKAPDENDMQEEEEEEFNKENVETTPFTYQLMGIISHVGDSVQHGHYICDIACMNDQKWLHFDDESVWYTTQRDVLRERKKMGYLFFYVAKEFLATCK